MTLTQLIIAAVFSTTMLAIVMAAAWLVQQGLQSSRWVDATWSFGVGAVGSVGALMPWQGGGPSWRQVAVAAAALIWGLRLGSHIAVRASSSQDDPRYRKLTLEWGATAFRRMFWFLQSQAAVGAILATAIILAAHNPAQSFRLADAIGFALLFAAVIGEGIADRQLRAFRHDPANRGRICDSGLWSRSRHPNYFFEWLSWAGYAVIAADFTGDHPYGCAALAAPAVMYWVLRYATGVPPLEQHMLETRGEAFRSYQQKVPAFFPRVWL